jgi:hypothetical protein
MFAGDRGRQAGALKQRDGATSAEVTQPRVRAWVAGFVEQSPECIFCVFWLLLIHR